jgi:DNA-binding NarL/FixJ family response regulator
MKIRAAVVDPLPLYRRGVTATLAAVGVCADTPDDIWTWLTDAPTQAVILSVCGSAEWRLLAELHAARPELLLLALLNTPDVRSYLRAVRSGAAGIVARAASPIALQQCFTAVVNGQVLLPVEVVRALVAGGGSEGELEASMPSEVERQWLRLLASGSTVTELAERAGYSERMMFRLLRALYDRLPARNRTEALIYARENDWI